MRIHILELTSRIHLGQSGRTHFDEESFRPFDLLSRDHNVRILLQGGQNRLFQRESRCRVAAFLDHCLTGIRSQRQKRNRTQHDAVNTIHSHAFRKGFPPGKARSNARRRY
jgi:hypothetical protein